MCVCVCVGGGVLEVNRFVSIRNHWSIPLQTPRPVRCVLDSKSLIHENRNVLENTLVLLRCSFVLLLCWCINNRKAGVGVSKRD